MTTPDDAAKAAQTQVSRRSRPGIVIVYAIRRRTDGKPYVGLTARHKEDRFRAHCADAMRNGGSRGQPGTITHAIREVISAGLDPREHFTMEVLAGVQARADHLADRMSDRSRPAAAATIAHGICAVRPEAAPPCADGLSAPHRAYRRSSGGSRRR